jgi:hypothetical protein
LEEASMFEKTLLLPLVRIPVLQPEIFAKVELPTSVSLFEL